MSTVACWSTSSLAVLLCGGTWAPGLFFASSDSGMSTGNLSWGTSDDNLRDVRSVFLSLLRFRSSLSLPRFFVPIHIQAFQKYGVVTDVRVSTNRVTF